MLLRLVFLELVASIIHAQISLWTMRFDGAGDDAVSDVVVDKQGSLILTGVSLTPQMTIYNSAEQPIHSLSDSSSRRIFIAKFSGDLQLQWTASFTSSPLAFFFAVKSIGSDVNDNILIGIDIHDQTLFTDSQNVTRILERTAASSDSIVVKLTPGGVYQWHVKLSGSERDILGSLAIDANNNVMVSTLHIWGNLTAQLNIYNSSNRVSLELSMPKRQIAMVTLVKFNSSGGLVWLARTELPSLPLNLAPLTAPAVAVDLNDNSAVFGSTVYATSAPSYEFYDSNNDVLREWNTTGVFGAVWKVTSDGRLLWSAKYDSAQADLLKSIKIDPSSSDVLFAGTILSVSALVSHTAGSTLILAGTSRSVGAILFRVSSDGALKWYARNRWLIGSVADNDRVRGLSLDPDGNVYFYGYYASEFGLEIFDSSQARVSSLPVGYYGSGFMIKYDRNGMFIWALRVDSLADGDVINAAAVLNGSLVVGGRYGPDILGFYDKNGIKKRQMKSDGSIAGFAASFDLDGLLGAENSQDPRPLVLPLGGGSHATTSSLSSLSQRMAPRETGTADVNQTPMIYVVIGVGVILIAIPIAFMISIMKYKKLPWEPVPHNGRAPAVYSETEFIEFPENMTIGTTLSAARR